MPEGTEGRALLAAEATGATVADGTGGDDALADAVEAGGKSGETSVVLGPQAAAHDNATTTKQREHEERIGARIAGFARSRSRLATTALARESAWKAA